PLRPQRTPRETKSAATDYRLPTTDHGLSTTDYPLLTTGYCLLTTELPTTDLSVFWIDQAESLPERRRILNLDDVGAFHFAQVGAAPTFRSEEHTSELQSP